MYHKSKWFECFDVSGLQSGIKTTFKSWTRSGNVSRMHPGRKSHLKVRSPELSGLVAECRDAVQGMPSWMWDLGLTPSLPPSGRSIPLIYLSLHSRKKTWQQQHYVRLLVHTSKCIINSQGSTSAYSEEDFSLNRPFFSITRGKTRQSEAVIYEKQ